MIKPVTTKPVTDKTGDDITQWLARFSEIVLEVQRRSIVQIDFILAKVSWTDGPGTLARRQ